MRTIPAALVCALLMTCQTGCIAMQHWWDNRHATNDNVADTDEAPVTADSEPVRKKSAGPDRGSRSATRVSTAKIGENTTPDRRPSENAVHAGALEIFDEFITVKDVLEPIQFRIREMAKTQPPNIYYQKAADLVRQQLYDLVAQYLVYRRAERQINDQIEPGLQKAIDGMERERINREFGGLETRYTKYLQDQGKTREEVRERLRRVVVVDSYLRDRLLPMVREPRKREIMEYYQSHLPEYSTPERRELFLIDIPIRAHFERFPPRPSDEPLARQKARNAIEAAAREIKSGKPFEEVARQYSELKKSDGGCWGFVSSPMAGRWEVPYKRFMEMHEGQVSEIIEAAKSFFIVKVGRVEETKVTSFRDAQPDIIKALKNKRYQKLKAEFLQKELKRASIGSLDAFGNQVMRAIPRPGFAAAP